MDEVITKTLPAHHRKGKLYLIPVPIAGEDPFGTLPQDTLEIIDKLRVFIVEDIRTARRFLRKAGYKGDFNDIVFHTLNEHSRAGDISEMLKEALNGKDAGILSEAGVPCVADPGAILVAAAHKSNIRVVPLTGPSSILLALMGSGFNGQNFTFHGYLPVKEQLRIAKLKELETNSLQQDQTQIFIETPYRNLQLFGSILKTCRENTMLCIACNLGAPEEKIISKPVSWWKKHQPDINKVPAVFLISHG